MAGVVVVTDGSADIPPPLADELGLLVAPVEIDCRDGHCLDDQLSRQDCLRRLQQTGKLPSMICVERNSLSFGLPATHGHKWRHR